MLARPALHRHLNESSPSPDEQKLLDNINKRLRLWSEIGPYYEGGEYNHKTAESRGTESVLNALILVNHAAGTGQLDDPTRVAMNYMWKEQKTSGELAGAWDWLQFDQEPWEAIDSPYYGACLAAVAVGLAPEDYRSSEEIQSRLSLLRDYLTREEPNQSTLSRAMFLWASSKLPGLATPEQQKALANELFRKQQQDGGWRLASLAWKWRGWTWKSLVNAWIREDGTPISGKSDGVATAIVIYSLQQSGVPYEDIHLQRGLSWLRTNQNLSQGSWPGYSINYRRDPASATGRFMSDAATAYAVLALSDTEPHQAPLPEEQASMAASKEPSRP
jgi:squalene-hopene/tetraprenyl-beta-curcumene cyclase